jgi:hypothetical protein
MGCKPFDYIRSGKKWASKKWKEFDHFFRICEMRTDKKRMMNVRALNSIHCAISCCCPRALNAAGAEKCRQIGFQERNGNNATIDYSSRVLNPSNQ